MAEYIEREAVRNRLQAHEDATGDMNFCPNCGADMRERKGDDGN